MPCTELIVAVLAITVLMVVNSKITCEFIVLNSYPSSSEYSSESSPESSPGFITSLNLLYIANLQCENICSYCYIIGLVTFQRCTFVFQRLCNIFNCYVLHCS